MFCKCGDDIAEKAKKKIAKLPLKKLNILDYPRCEGCLSILASSVLRLKKAGKVFNFAQ